MKTITILTTWLLTAFTLSGCNSEVKRQTQIKLNNFNVSSIENVDLRSVKQSMADDNLGLLRIAEPSPLISKTALNPITVSNFAAFGDTSIRFELNHGECGEEPKWSDCDNSRERTELTFEKEFANKEKWYRFMLFFPEEHRQAHPAKLSLIQWKRFEKPSSKVLVMFQHLAGGLVFNRNGDTFPDSYVMLLDEKNMYDRWIEIVFNTNWNPSKEKGFMKVWVDGDLKVDFSGRSHSEKAETFSLRYGLYSSWLHRFQKIAPGVETPKRTVQFDGVRAERQCSELFDEKKCNSLLNQKIKTHRMFTYLKDSADVESWQMTEDPISKLR